MPFRSDFLKRQSRQILENWKAPEHVAEWTGALSSLRYRGKVSQNTLQPKVDHISLGMQLVKRNGMRFMRRPDGTTRDMRSLPGNPVRYDNHDALPMYTTLLVLLLAFSILWSDIRYPFYIIVGGCLIIHRVDLISWSDCYLYAIFRA